MFGYNALTLSGMTLAGLAIAAFGRDFMTYRVEINGETRELDVPGEMPLLWALRNELGMVGTKFGCGIAMCGACTVHVDGVATRSCQTPVGSLANKKVTTIEALHDSPIGRALQQAWVEEDVM